jgi:hypothetical protein
MKRFPLFKLLSLVALVFGGACTDETTAPTTSPKLLAPQGPSFAGHEPPPPVGVAIMIEVNSHVALIGPFEGRYFSNGKTAWLQFNNSQSDEFGTSASSNARFMLTNNKMSGHGTLEIQGHTVTIENVTLFSANPDCGITGEPCAAILFDAKVDGISGHHGEVESFNREACTFVPGDEEIPGHFECSVEGGEP